MTPTRSATPNRRPADVDLGETRSRFLFARAQTRAHALTADYLQAREAGIGEAAATARPPAEAA